MENIWLTLWHGQLKTDFTTWSDADLKNRLEELEGRFQKHDLTQKTMKVALNSLYGCLGNQYFVFYDIRMAEAITLTGRLLIMKVGNGINDFLCQATGVDKDYWTYSDTDSILMDFSGVADKYFPNDSYEEQIEKIVRFADGPASKRVDEILQEVCKITNAFDPSALSMGREVVCDAGIFVGKKKYTLSIADDEGIRLNPPSHKITGLDSKRAVYSQKVRDKLKAAYWTILHQKSDQDIIDFVDEFRKEFHTWELDDIVQVTGVNNIEKFINNGMKGAPAHVKAAVSHNNFIIKNNLTDAINPIQSGSKIKLVRLVMPNPTMGPVFAYEGDWKEEYGLQDYFDHNEQFDRSFISPLHNLTNHINMSTAPPEVFDIF